MSVNDPWGFPVENPDKFENPNYGPDASLCAQSFASCSPKSIDFDDSWRWGNIPDAPSTGPKTPVRITSVTLPAVPYTGLALNSAASATQWAAAVTWSPAHSTTALGTVYTASYTLTPKGRYYFDPDAPPAVSVSTSNGSGGSVSASAVVGDNEGGNVATLTATVVYSAVVNKPVAPPSGNWGYRGCFLNTSRVPLSSVEGSTYLTSDVNTAPGATSGTFRFIEQVTQAQATQNWNNEPIIDQDDGGRAFLFMKTPPARVIEVNLGVEMTSSFTVINSVTIDGETFSGFVQTAESTGSYIRFQW